MDEVKKKNVFANFQILGPLGCQGWVVIPQNVKKSKNHCTLLFMFHFVEKYIYIQYTIKKTTLQKALER